MVVTKIYGWSKLGGNSGSKFLMDNEKRNKGMKNPVTRTNIVVFLVSNIVDLLLVVLEK